MEYFVRVPFCFHVCTNHLLIDSCIRIKEASVNFRNVFKN